MFAPERQETIVAHINDHGGATVQELALRFNVTQETIRRDLEILSQQSLIRRVHGGAVRLDRFAVAEKSLSERSQQNRPEKTRIARAALQFLPHPTNSIALDAGTTTERLAKHLPTHAQADSLVITHSIPVAAQLMHHENIQLELLGGRIRGITCSAVGANLTQHIVTLRPDVSFIAANSIHPHFGLSTPEPEEAAVKTALVKAGRLTVALIDSSKFNQESLVQFSLLRDIDVLITDVQPPKDLTTALNEANVEVVVA